MKRRNRPLCFAWFLFLISEIFAVLMLVMLNSFDYHLHVLIMGGCMVVVNGHGMVLFRLLPGVRTHCIKYIHTFIHTVVLAGFIYGALAIMDSAKLALHTFIGLFIAVLYLIQWIVAVFVYLYMYSNQRRRKIYASWHNFMGIVILQLSIANSCLQLQDLTYEDNNNSVNIAMICAVIYGILINAIVLNPYLEWRLVGPL